MIDDVWQAIRRFECEAQEIAAIKPDASDRERLKYQLGLRHGRIQGLVMALDLYRRSIALVYTTLNGDLGPDQAYTYS